MKPSISDLSQLSDDQLFEETSKGIALILDNADSLDSMAVRLAQLGEHRGAAIVRALAEEESAKVLVLLDVVRCLLDELKNRSRAIKGFGSHLAKRIYTKACWWRSADFAEVERAIARERASFYLDGPNEVDWIFPNSAKTERELLMYVDYVKDITKDDGEHRWVSPLTHREDREYQLGTPMSLATVRALHYIGVTSAKGLSIVADVWRSFKPVPQTRYFSDLAPRIEHTLGRVIQQGLCPEIGSHYRTVIDHWPFPLWSLNLTPLKVAIEELRSERQEYIEDLKVLEAQRDPPPQIERKKIEVLSRAYDDWVREPDQQIYDHADLESYTRLDGMMRELTLEERMDLAALAWFGRDPQSGWEYCYNNARKRISEGSTSYICELGKYWLRGLERWESDPELPASLRSGEKEA